MKKGPQNASSDLTVPVYVEDGTPGDYGLEILDLVIRSDERTNEECGTDDGKVDGEKQSHEGKESHGGDARGGEVVDRSPGA